MFVRNSSPFCDRKKNIYPNVTKEFMYQIAKFSAIQRKPRADENKMRSLNQTHNRELAKNFKPINKKLVEKNESNKKLERILKKQVLKL